MHFTRAERLCPEGESADQARGWPSPNEREAVGTNERWNRRDNREASLTRALAGPHSLGLQRLGVPHPHPHRPVITGGGQASPVGAERHPPEKSRMPPEG